MDFTQFIQQAQSIREQYHQLEREHHGKIRTLEEDALAFLTDAALVGRMIMAQEQRWPHDQAAEQLAHKLGECMWRLAVLAHRSGLDIHKLTQEFIENTKNTLSEG